MTGFRTIIIITLILLCSNLLAHSGKARYHIIIETDGEAADLRAISLLLASEETEVIGIYYTNAVYDMDQVKTSLQDLLIEYHHEGVDVGTTVEFIKRIYKSEDEKVTYISLSTIQTVIDYVCIDENLIAKTEQVICFDKGQIQDTYLPIISGGIPLLILSNDEFNIPQLNKAFISRAENINSRYARHLCNENQALPVQEEITAIYLHDPTIFHEMGSVVFQGSKGLRPSSPEMITTVYLEMLKEKEPNYKIFSHIPLEPEYFQDDIVPYIDSICSYHGESEWRAGVLCFELHGHIGIYAIFGVKMGLRAREYFNIGLDDLQIDSHAGLVPPYSCLNDGLQVSTGSSLGHGLISVNENLAPQVSATFHFKDRHIMISIKEEIATRIQEDIKNCILKYGTLTPAYWEAVRALALDYWLQFDRNQIFTIKKIS